MDGQRCPWRAAGPYQWHPRVSPKNRASTSFDDIIHRHVNYIIHRVRRLVSNVTRVRLRSANEIYDIDVLSPNTVFIGEMI